MPMTRYLPPTLFNDGFFEVWFGKHLASMEEPILWDESAGDGFRSRFRMLVLPSFDHPCVIGIDEHADGRIILRHLRTEGLGGYDAGPITERHVAQMDAAAFARIVSARDTARFTQRLPDNRGGREFPEASPGEGGVWLDGTQLVFELWDRTGHYLVTRHEGALDAPMRALADALLSTVAPPSQSVPHKL